MTSTLKYFTLKYEFQKTNSLPQHARSICLMLANITHNIIFHNILVQYLPTECKRKWADGCLWAGAVFHLGQDVVPNDLLQSQ